jgi:PKD repeat protein|tara:strand:- start:2276 stop:6100 length:3825 start_codon:yes stop_codon:yes gene_type:complete
MGSGTNMLPCGNIMFSNRFIPALFVWLCAMAVHGQCTVPGNLNLLNRSSNHIKVGFTSSATYHQVSYGTLSFNPGSGSQSAWITAKVYQANGLEASTGYDFYVRDSCSNGSVSAWSPYFAQSTLCGVAVIPWFESFDQEAFTQQSSWGTAGSMPNCWPRTPSIGYFWDVAPALFSSNFTGPSQDHTGRLKYASMEWINSTTPGTSGILRTPQISLDTFSSPELAFWYHMYGNGIDKLVIQARNKNGSSLWTTLNTLTGQQQSSAANAWKEEVLQLGAFQGDTVFIRFVAYRNTLWTQLAEISIDDIHVRQGSGCAKPSNLLATNATASTASLSWNVGNGSLERISYGSPGISATAGTQANASGGSHTLTGLSPNTNYVAYVKDSCTSGSSSWVGPVPFRTSCLPVSAPFSENFDGSSWTVGGWGQLGGIPSCWQRPDTVNFFWTPGPPVFPTFNTGPTNDHSPGSGGKYLMSLGVGFLTSPSAHVLSPLIDLSPLDTATVTFWYHMYGAQIDSMVLDISNGSGWSQIWHKSGQQQTSKTDAWKEAIIDVSAYADDSIQLRWRAVKSTAGFSNQSQMAIDDVSVHEKASCSKPANLSITATSTNSVSLDWTGGGSPWQVAYGTPGFMPSASNTVTASNKPFTVNGLNPGTTYAFYVRDSCGLAGVSDWLGPIQATTQCAPVTAPWSENFNGSDWVELSWWPQVNSQIADCWNRSDTTLYYWTPKAGATPWVNTGPSGDVQGSGKYLYTNIGSSSNLSSKITTPWIDVTPLDTPEVHFYSHLFGSNITSLQVAINDGSGWTNIGTITPGAQTAKTSAWTETIINLYAYRNDTFRLRFTGSRSSGWWAMMGLDDISVTEAPKPICTPPTSLTLTNISPTSGNLGFSSGSGQSQVAWGVSGFTPSTSMGSVSSSPYILTGLISSTSYDAYVRDSCGPTFYSAWVGPITFSTLPCPNISAVFTHSGTQLNRTFSASNPVLGHSYQWDFGDGNQGVGHPVNHNYATAGNYAVTLIQSNSCGGTDSVTQSTQVCGQLLAGFTASISGNSALFTSTSTGASSLLWDFGDGNSSATNPVSHSYASNGVYTVILTVYNACGLSSVSSQSVTICEVPTPAFTTAILSSGSSGMWVESDASLSVGVNNYNWSWGDGTTSSGGPVKQHHYAVPSLSYVITLTIDNVCGGSASLSKQLGEMIGLDENRTQENALYPNPSLAGSVVHWAGFASDPGPIQLSNFSGKILHDPRGQWDNKVLTITLPSDLPSGMYILQCAGVRAQLAIISN